MKELAGLKSVLWVQVMFFINASFFVFIGFDIWKKSDDLSIYFLYFAMLIGYRAFAIPISARFVLKNKTNGLIVASYVSALILGVAVLYGTNNIENPYILVHLYSMPLAFFTTMFQIGSNQMIINTVKKEQYEKFFYITSLFRNGIDMLVPIMIGFAIFFVSDIYSYVIMILVSVVSLIVTLRLPKIETGFKNKTFKDVMKQKETGPGKAMSRLHYLFIVIAAFVIQFLDIGIQNYLATIGENEWGIGLLKGFFVLVLFGIFVWKSKTKQNDKKWFYVAGILTFIVLVMDIATNGKGWDTAIMVLMVGLMYVIHSSSISLSFKMVDTKTPFDQFAVLLKREVIRNLAKATVALAGFIFTLQNTESIDYKIFTAVILIFVVMAIILYGKLDKTITKEN